MTYSLKPSADRKTRFWKGQKNTFGLMPGPDYTCKCATLGPGGCCYVRKGRKLPTCYVYKIMSAYSGVRSILEFNTCLLMDADYTEKVRLLSTEFSRFRRIEIRRDEPKLYYRLHWAGDVFNEEYAKALSVAMTAHPDIQFWAYTRCFGIVPTLCKTSNLRLYLSLDRINLAEGMKAYFQWLDNPDGRDNVQICYMSKENDFEEHYTTAYYAQQVAGTLRQYLDLDTNEFTGLTEGAIKLKECPADVGKMPKEESCAKCRQCLGTHGGPSSPVWFAS